MVNTEVVVHAAIVAKTHEGRALPGNRKIRSRINIAVVRGSVGAGRLEAICVEIVVVGACIRHCLVLCVLNKAKRSHEIV